MIPGVWYQDRYGRFWKRLSNRSNLCVNENGAGIYIHQDRQKDWKLIPSPITDSDVKNGLLSKYGF